MYWWLPSSLPALTTIIKNVHLFPNPWCSLTVFPCYTRHFILLSFSTICLGLARYIYFTPSSWDRGRLLFVCIRKSSANHPVMYPLTTQSAEPLIVCVWCELEPWGQDVAVIVYSDEATLNKKIYTRHFSIINVNKSNYTRTFQWNSICDYYAVACVADGTAPTTNNERGRYVLPGICSLCKIKYAVTFFCLPLQC